MGIYSSKEYREDKYGLWQMGKKVKWFNAEEVQNINLGILDYVSFYEPGLGKDKKEQNMNRQEL